MGSNDYSKHYGHQNGLPKNFLHQHCGQYCSAKSCKPAVTHAVKDSLYKVSPIKAIDFRYLVYYLY